MQITIEVRYKNQQPAVGVIIRLVNPEGSESVTDSAVIAEGRTSESGRWVFERDTVAGTQRLALIILEPDSEEVLYFTPPTLARNIPNRVRVEIGGQPSVSEPEPWPGEEDPRPKPQPPGSPRRSYTEILGDRLNREEQIRQAEADLLGRRIQNSFRRRREGRNFANQFLGKKPLGKKPVPHFVPADRDISGRLEDLIRSGAGRITESIRSKQRGITVRPGTIADLLPQEGGTFPANRVDALLASLMPGNQARATASPLQICRARQWMKSKISEFVANREAEAPANEDAGQLVIAEAATDTDAEIEKVMAVLSRAQTIAQRPTVTEVAEGLNTNLPSGPADATSFYDFHSLQIAWEDTWTGLVDANMVRRVQELYDSLVQTMPDGTNMDALREELREIGDLHELLDTLEDAASAMSANILSDSQLSAWIPEISEKWHNLTPLERDKLGFLYDVHIYVNENPTRVVFNGSYGELSENKTKLSTLFENFPADWLPSNLTVYGAYDSNWAEIEAKQILDNAVDAPGPRIGRVDELIKRLKKLIARPYQFDVFAEGSYNYGLLTTYRQEWHPITYQPGDLAGTIALAPNETRRYRISRKTTRSASSTQTTTTLDAQNRDTSDMSRSEGEIVNRAKSSLNLSSDAEVGVKFGISFTGGGEFGADQSIESSQTKSTIRESTRSAAQEYRDERKVEVSTKRSFESEVSEEREITNPNNELTVTYLFYELQRRFQVVERLYDVQPVVLVAYPVPPPHIIDEAWLLKHEWILHKVLLDGSLHPVLRMLSQDFAGDELAVEVYEKQWKTQIAIVAELREQMEGHATLREEARAAIQRAAQAARNADKSNRKILEDVKDVALVAVGGVGALAADALFKKVTDDPSIPVTSAAESGREALDWADTDLAAAQDALGRGVSALEVATERYVQAVRDRLNRRVRIDKLILHVKSNILHYMQAIWRHEHSDERYMRLYDMEVVWPSWGGAFTYVPLQASRLQRVSLPPVTSNIGLASEGRLFPPSVSLDRKQKLHQVADLSRLLGFKGNYGIFALREANALTTTMAVDYLDTEFGVTDPDFLGNTPTAEEAVELAQCAWNHPTTTEDDKQQIAEWLVETLKKAHSASQEIIVPTGELFIEALPGSHPLLEDFKLEHRAHDVARASADAQMAALEALRRASLLKDSNYSDPDIDKRIEIQGDMTNISLEAD